MPNPPSTQSVCPTCGSDDPSELFNMLDRGRSYDAGISGCPDPFHDPDTQTEECYDDSHAGYNSETGACLTCGKLVHGVLYGDELRRAEGMCKAPPSRAELWRCPECGAAAWHSTAEYPLPGGPALCTHPTPIYERFTLAEQLDQAERRVEEAKADASEANHQANMMSRNLQAANALAASYRDVGERMLRMTINGALCQDDEDACPLCREMWADLRKLLNPPSTSEGDA